jgi:hypothetical protein
MNRVVSNMAANSESPDLNAAVTPPPPPVLNYAAPPGEPVPGEPPPPYKLFSVGAVTLATLIGSPLAGAVLMAINYRRLDRKRTANACVVWGIVGTAALFGLAFILPARIPTPIVAVVPIVVMNSIAKFLQGEDLQRHERRRGQRASLWAAAGIGVASLALVLCLLLGGGLIADVIANSKKINYSPVEDIRYSGQANQNDARKLGDLLKQEGYFTGQHPKTVLLAKDGAGTTVTFVVGKDAWDDPSIVAVFRHIGDDLATNLGKPLTVRLCDQELTVKKEIPIK